MSAASMQGEIHGVEKTLSLLAGQGSQDNPVWLQSMADNPSTC